MRLKESANRVPSPGRDEKVNAVARVIRGSKVATERLRHKSELAAKAASVAEEAGRAALKSQKISGVSEDPSVTAYQASTIDKVIPQPPREIITPDD